MPTPSANEIQAIRLLKELANHDGLRAFINQGKDIRCAFCYATTPVREDRMEHKPSCILLRVNELLEKHERENSYA